MPYSENNTFEKIMDRCLSNKILENVDKRAGSIIYDALAPVCLELAEAYAKMDIMEEQTYLMTATGSNLDRRVYDYGINRNTATNALRIGQFKKYKTDDDGNFVYDSDGEKILVDMDISEGSRFTVPEDSSITFKYTGKTSGYNILQCEQTGTKGNKYVGTILPLTPIKDLIEAKIISTYEPAEDNETDEDLRSRVKDHLNYLAYGGNIPDYIEKVNSIDGVGNVKVFPAWQYNGSVLLSVVDTTFDPISVEFAKNLKEQIDPDEFTGEGVGIAPIGHYVTITTPVKKYIDVTISLETTIDAEQGEIIQTVNDIIKNYFYEVRKSFAQDVRLGIYRAKIIQLILSNISEVLNVSNVLLNNSDEDIIYTDEGLLEHQYLPYVNEIIIN